MGIFYNYCKYNTRLIFHLLYNNVLVNGMENIPKDKPVLLAINHPNSFLDAVIVGAAINRPTHFLARGDAFKNKFTLPILKSLNMLPVYRLSEGKENLNKNSETFDSCQNILEENKVVIIFAEGLSENNWALRSLKKGPARIAIKAWNSQTPAKDLVIIPIGLTYEHYTGIGKNLLINIGKPFGRESLIEIENEALFVKKFNEKISNSLEDLIYVNPNLVEGSLEHQDFRKKFQKAVKENKSNSEIIQSLKSIETSQNKLREPAFIVYSILFAPLYFLSKWLAPKIIKQPLFFDSILFGLVLFLWPVYLIILGLLLGAIFNP